MEKKREGIFVFLFFVANQSIKERSASFERLCGSETSKPFQTSTRESAKGDAATVENTDTDCTCTLTRAWAVREFL